MDHTAGEEGAGAAALRGAAFEEAAVGLAVLSPDGATFLTANRALCVLLGYPAGGLAGLPAAAVAGEDGGADGSARGVRDGIRTWRGADGRCLDVRVRGSDGPRRVLCVDPVDPDEAARSAENREALIAAGLGEWRWDAGSGQLVLSRRAGQILGFPAGRTVAWTDLRGAMAPPEVERIKALVREALARNAAYAFEGRMRRPADGAEVIIGVRGQPVAAPDGALAGMVGVVQDVTVRVAARNEVAARDQRLRVAASLAKLGIFEWHMLEDRAIWENDRMFEIFGHAPGDGTIGKTEFLGEILHPEDREGVRRAISRALREDGILQVTGRIRRRGDGAWRSIDMAGRFERDAPDRLPRRLIGVVADVTDRRRAEERQSLLIRELHHRVKNTLATVQAIVGSTARTASSIESFYEAFVGRIKSLAHTHTVLTEDTWQTASLRGLLTAELRPYAEEAADGEAEGRVRLDGPAIDLPSEVAVPIGMAIHELTTNAAKYGALSDRAGRVAVTWALLSGGAAGRLHFVWQESGGPIVRPPTRQGFGSRLLQRVLTTQVQADVEIDYAPAGFRLTMLAPLPARNEALNPLT